MRQYSLFQFEGATYTTELAIGLAAALPISWLRFYMPGACARNLVHLTNDILEATLHWNEITMLEQGWIYSDDSSDSDSDTLNIGRSIYYLMINNESFMMTLPLLYNTCGSGSSGTPIVSQFTNFTSLFNNHIVESAKTVEYIDMAL